LTQKTVSIVGVSIAIGLSVVFLLYALNPQDDGLSITEKCEKTKNYAPCIEDTPPRKPIELTEIGKYKVSQLQAIAANFKIQEILKSSNEDFSAMSPEVLANWLDTKEKEWISAPTDEPTPFMVSIITSRYGSVIQ